MKTESLCRYILELPTFEYGCLVGLSIKDGTKQRQGALISDHCLISHRWYDVVNLTVPGNSNLKVQHTTKFCVKEMKQKSATFFFLILKAKEISSKSSGRGQFFCREFRSFLSMLMFTHSASCWSRSHRVVET